MSIKEMFNHGHIYGTTRDLVYEDIDVNIPDYWFGLTYGSDYECVDSDGSEHKILSYDDIKKTVLFELHCSTRIWERYGKQYEMETAIFTISAKVIPDEDGSYEYGTLTDITIESAHILGMEIGDA
jgi:hypothetical protein